MKQILFSLASVVLVAACMLPANEAGAQSTLTLTCEGGDPNSWKVCEVQPDTYPTYVWSVSGRGVLDPSVCNSSSSICTAYCQAGTGSGTLHVSVYNSANQLVGTRSKSLGCV
ncbi:MAG: hypothetical protein JNM58_15855 [Xanthomonadaceae bacterium]|nr:hypothetical protein [Xanthomonadaceae bacterium]